MQPIPVQRLHNQHLAGQRVGVVEVVAALGAMQAQDYAGGVWAVGLRAKTATEAAVEAALADGEILRTHPMRGTHHFVAKDDMRWMIGLFGQLMIKRIARRNRELDLDDKQLAKALDVIARACEGGNHLDRAGVAAALTRAKISPEGQRIAHIIYRAELEGLVCSGRRKGKQVTIALFDERVPKSKPRTREESLADLARRYFTTRGPASERDFSWWCQLPAADVREAIALAGDDLIAETIDGTKLLRGAKTTKAAKGPRAYLLPPFDEYTVAYADRSHVGAPPATATTFNERTMLGPNLVLDGQVIGSWKRTAGKKKVTIELSPWQKVATKDRGALEEAAVRYAAFLGLEPDVRI
ncbi:MAG: winged helix DNA-binding domain-containing protein [Kofleriaceae bacterium]|nr:winged helix DNA-binding domain-containing protein [Kofleriaceae bacterium]